MRKVVLVLCLLALASVAFAQASKPAPTIMAQPNRIDVQRGAVAQIDPVVLLQRQMARLQTQVLQLRKQVDILAKDAAAARAAIPKCSDDLRQSISASGSRDCAPYVCDPVVGTCLMSCATSNDCTPGTACNMEPARCEYPAPSR